MVHFTLRKPHNVLMPWVKKKEEDTGFMITMREKKTCGLISS